MPAPTADSFMSPPPFTKSLTLNPPFNANTRALFARAPNLGNKENRDCGLGLKKGQINGRFYSKLANIVLKPLRCCVLVGFI